jgi:hypothetical protein
MSATDSYTAKRTEAIVEAHGGRKQIRESAYWLMVQHAEQLERELEEAKRHEPEKHQEGNGPYISGTGFLVYRDGNSKFVCECIKGPYAERVVQMFRQSRSDAKCPAETGVGWPCVCGAYHPSECKNQRSDATHHQDKEKP